jgi:apolipoprotein D and lipocalin family protein
MGVIVSPRYLLMALFGASIFLSTACTFLRKDVAPPLQAVPRVNLERYTGTWFEIARFPHRFQEGCWASSATYTLRSDGTIEVLNQCRKGSPDGKVSSARGKAWVVDRETNAKLKVSFFWPFSGDYWVIDLGENYEYAVVGHPNRKYLWILSRTPQMEEPLYQRILERLRNQSYDLSKLIHTAPSKPSGLGS